MPGERLRGEFFDRGVEAFRRAMHPEFFDDHPDVTGLYVCPICTGAFPRKATEAFGGNSQLTLEDVPPKTYPGTSRPMALTCATCNHGASGFEAHLGRHASVVRGNIPPQQVKVVTDEFELNVDLHVTSIEDGGANARLDIDPNRNDPDQMRRLGDVVPIGSTVELAAQIQGRPLYDRNAATLALVKAGFVLVFAAFGYTWALAESVRELREMIAAALHSGLAPEDVPRSLVSHDNTASHNDRRLALVSQPAPAILVQFGQDIIVLPWDTSPPDLYDLLAPDDKDTVNVRSRAIVWPKPMALTSDFGQIDD